ncbi:terminase small subunit [Veillonella atypica]|uniref:terminase small subunit n=1 Tax=Veillonella atypica TaxID=39777 RepID=UPI001D073EE5|nr:terminase small subunit [Veillonella atypica]MCB6769840.1 terminase small subunit [Veillonella atypica]DAE50023.1 MAG TPA: Terminase small subunit [Caudoviricetes sp.]
MSDIKLKPKELKFAEEWLKTTNATQSAIKAGYSERTAYSAGNRLLKKVDVKQYIDERLAEMQESSIADTNEVMQFLSSTMRGDIPDQFGLDPALNDRLKAAELLGKRYKLFTDKQEISGADGEPIKVIFSNMNKE